jgi:hypothetical protein
VRALELAEELQDAIEPLLKTHEHVCAQIELADKKSAQAVAHDDRVQRLTTVPSVGPVTAVTFIALVDDVARFESSDRLQSYLGLVPREYSSGEKQVCFRHACVTRRSAGGRLWARASAPWSRHPPEASPACAPGRGTHGSMHACRYERLTYAEAGA